MPNKLWISASGLLLGSLASACIDASARPCVEPTAGTQAAAGTPVAASVGKLKTCAAAAKAPDGLIDDFEDGSTQVAPQGGRDGYWWTHVDPKGSTLEPLKFAPEDGGPTGSTKVLHVKGVTAGVQDAYGASIGANFASSLYDASAYAGIAFKAKVGPNSSKKVRLKIGDVNTHGQMGTCKDCWNHFGKDLTLTNEWQEYTVMFSETTQVPGWGDPKPPSITPAQLASLDFSIGPGQTFDLWVDDLQFVTCP